MEALMALGLLMTGSARGSEQSTARAVVVVVVVVKSAFVMMKRSKVKVEM